MPFIIEYLIKLSVSLAVVYLFYRFILRPLTFYTWNRWYLVGYSLIAFVIPFIDINPVLNAMGPEQAVVINLIPVIDPAALQNQSWFNINNRWNWILGGILAGMLVMLIRLSAQFLSYYKLRESSTLLAADPVRIFQVDKNIVPFSFGNSIFINRDQHGELEIQEIIQHEFIHVRQKHTADMIWAEVLCILNWYNPFAWLIKKVICQNLEFIADQQVLKNGLDKKEYQYLLLKVAGGASFRITNQFNFSFLRKRITMMNKMNSAKFHLVKFLFVLPLLAVLLLSFREDIGTMLNGPQPGNDPDKANALTSVDYYLQGTDTIPAKSKQEAINIRSGDTSTHWKDESLFSTKGKNRPLFIVDEVIKDGDCVRGLDPNSIARVEVLKNEHALQYGEKGKNGVVRIYTKPNYRADSNSGEKMEISVTDKKQIGLHFVRDSITIEADSVYFDKKQLHFSSRDSVFTDDSRHLQLINDPIDASLDKTKAPGVIRVRGKVTNPDVVILIDGVRQPAGTDLKNLDPNSIQSMTILKDAQAVALYGPDAVNGAISITTKVVLQVDQKPAGVKVTDSIPRKSGTGRNH
ncbi:TonB-dependent receptor plug domain-containing protein [Flavitalea antarctica]